MAPLAHRFYSLLSNLFYLRLKGAITMSEVNDRVRMRNEQWTAMWSKLTEKGWKTVPLWEDGAPEFHPEYEQV
jgi:hypothetical protein